jgi:hypothetical protein
MRYPPPARQLSCENGNRNNIEIRQYFLKFPTQKKKEKPQRNGALRVQVSKFQPNCFCREFEVVEKGG